MYVSGVRRAKKGEKAAGKAKIKENVTKLKCPELTEVSVTYILRKEINILPIRCDRRY